MVCKTPLLGSELCQTSWHLPMYKIELSKYVWKLKKKNTTFSITWKIISHSMTKRRLSNQCNLCLAEKYQILKHSEKKRAY